MRWKNYLSLLLLAFLVSVFGPFLAGLNQEVSAAQLCSYTFTASKSSSEEYCLDHFSEIEFVKFDFGVDSSVHGLQVGYNTLNYSNSGGRISYTIGFSSLPYNYIQQVVGATEEYPVTVSFYDSFPSDCPSAPSGSLSITENGTYDVTSYTEAVVDIPPEIIQGDYHDDLISINNTIMIIPAVALVIYFMFCIYRMLLRGRS